ncbi:MAG: hypothetical protein RIR92_689 [Pseudomonadota bacterium]|jgi:hypothetical protein
MNKERDYGPAVGEAMAGPHNPRMRKNYPLHVEGRHPDRVLDAIKHDVRKYLKRERRRPLPADVDFWDFQCRFGLSAEAAQTVHLSEVITSIDAAAKEQATQVYVEIITTHGKRTPRPVMPDVQLLPVNEEEDDLPE